MADTAVVAPVEWVPVDSFGARLALVRQHMGWNVKEAAEACGVNGQSWHNWENGGSPRDYERVCRRVADATGCDIRWLLAGGSLRSRCLYVIGHTGQTELALEWSPRPALVAV